jgi:hypothetical protein
MNFKILTKIICCIFILKFIPADGSDKTKNIFLKADSFKHYVGTFNRYDQENVVNYIPNALAWDWMIKNIPLFECPDKDIEEIYYFRWWTYRKHICKTQDGFVVTEFLPQVSWSKKYNSINCAVGHHLYEGRWIHDPHFLDDYSGFYFGKGGDPGGISKAYSNWIADGIYARYLVNADTPFLAGLLDSLVKNYEAWSSDGIPGNPWQKSRKLDNGMFWQIDSWEGGEFSIGGTGICPIINSYMYGDAMAISNIARQTGHRELAEQYRKKAKHLQQLILGNLWDSEAEFFKLRRDENVPTNQYNNPAAEKCDPGKLVKVREIFGYVPWYFNLPDDGGSYSEAWRQLNDPDGFMAEFGPTVAERRHPNFSINETGCQWCGASWPFSTSMTLTALANLLNNYHQNIISRIDYFNVLKTYTGSQHKKLNDGTRVPWIDESLNPDTGIWIPITGDPLRGRDYNHSTYCDLIITGLAGLRPRADNVIEVNPLVPEGVWDFFCLDNVLYHGHIITIIYDKTGMKYGKGTGLMVFSDGEIIASNKALQVVTGKLQ